MLARSQGAAPSATTVLATDFDLKDGAAALAGAAEAARSGLGAAVLASATEAKTIRDNSTAAKFILRSCAQAHHQHANTPTRQRANEPHQVHLLCTCVQMHKRTHRHAPDVVLAMVLISAVMVCVALAIRNCCSEPSHKVQARGPTVACSIALAYE